MKPTREEYELAAKAAGIVIKWRDADIPLADFFAFNVAPCGRWNPLGDDGDSRRLQVACGICLRINNAAKEVHVTLDWMQEYPSSSKQGARPIPQACGIYSFEGYNNDRYEAARHAVFELAVEIGRGMS